MKAKRPSRNLRFESFDNSHFIMEQRISLSAVIQYVSPGDLPPPDPEPDPGPLPHDPPIIVPPLDSSDPYSLRRR